MLRSRRNGGTTRWLGALVSVALLVTVAAAAGHAQPLNGKVVAVRGPMSSQLRPALDGSVIVKPRAGVAAADVQALLARLGATIVRPLVHGQMLVLQLAPGANMQQGMTAMFDSRLFELVEPNGIVVAYGEAPPIRPRDRVAALPGDPMWSDQWGPIKINCPQAWDIQQGSAGVTIAIVDTGVDYMHEDLAGHAWTNSGEIPGDGLDNDGNGFIDDVYGWDFADNDGDPRTTLPDSAYSHGSHCAGIASADTDNGVGIAGVAWYAGIMAVRVLGPSGGLDSWCIDGITYAADNGADVISMSFGPMIPSFSTAYQPAIDAAYAAGVTVVAAAGNSYWEITTDPNSWFSPVCNDGDDPATENHILGVMATDVNDMKADFSNYGNAYKMMDICAPGVDILSTIPVDDYARWDGTSMACPHVSGAAALMVAQFGRNPARIIQQIRDGADNIDAENPMYVGKLGTGRLNVNEALGIDKPPAAATAVNAFDTANDEGGSLTITWRRSADDGAGYDDVTGYELWRGTQDDPSTSPFVRVADQSDLPPRSSGYIDTDAALVNNQTYYYFVRTFDASQSTDSAVSAGASPRDDSSPPAIDSLVAQDTQADNGRSITLSWVGYTGAADLQRFRVYRSLDEFTSVTDTAVTLVGEIDNAAARSFIDKAQDPEADPAEPEAQPLDQTDYWYAVTALDEVGNSITTVTPTGPVQCAPNLSFSFGYGLRMITVPAEPIKPSPADVFSFTDPAAESFARYDPLTQAYHTVAQAPSDPYLQIAPGRAFWLNRKVPSFIGVGGRLVDDLEAEVALEQGWNQVGSPYDADCAFEGVTVRDQLGTDTPITASDLVSKYGWRYDAFARSYKLLSPILTGADRTLPKREGMWIYAKAAGLKLVFENNVAVVGETAAAAAPKLDGWQVQLIARTADAADTDNLLGVTSQAASLGPILSPPPVGAGVDLYFTNGGAGRLAADLRKSAGPQSKWQAVVECAAGDTEVELSWPDLSSLPHNIRPVLKDLASGRAVYMRTATGYTFRSREAGEQRRFVVTCDSPSAGPVVASLSAAPVKSGGVELAYTLARAASVTVEVRNLAGRLVTTVPVASGQAGLNRVVWNGQSAGGQAVPNGRYLICVTAVADDNGESASAVTPVGLTR